MKPNGLFGAAAFLGVALLIIAGGALAMSSSYDDVRKQNYTATETHDIQQGAWIYLNQSTTDGATGFTDEITVIDSDGYEMNASEDYTYNASKLRVTPHTCGDTNQSSQCLEHGETARFEYKYAAVPDEVSFGKELSANILGFLPWITLLFVPLGILGLLVGLGTLSTGFNTGGGR